MTADCPVEKVILKIKTISLKCWKYFFIRIFMSNFISNALSLFCSIWIIVIQMTSCEFHSKIANDRFNSLDKMKEFFALAKQKVNW